MLLPKQKIFIKYIDNCIWTFLKYAVTYIVILSFLKQLVAMFLNYEDSLVDSNFR